MTNAQQAILNDARQRAVDAGRKYVAATYSREENRLWAIWKVAQTNLLALARG
jgi:hypothetical protein